MTTFTHSSGFGVMSSALVGYLGASVLADSSEAAAASGRGAHPKHSAASSAASSGGTVTASARHPRRHQTQPA